MQVMHPICCGIDVHQKSINATIRMHTFGNLKMYKIDSSVIMIQR